jgi:hypothetical protein
MVSVQKVALHKRKALPITDTELKLIAVPSMTGLRSWPKKGYSTPAAV